MYMYIPVIYNQQCELCGVHAFPVLLPFFVLIPPASFLLTDTVQCMQMRSIAHYYSQSLSVYMYVSIIPGCISLCEPEEGTPPLHERKQYGSEAVVLIGGLAYLMIIHTSVICDQ